MNGPVKLAAIALALLVALMLLDMSFSLVSVGINTPGSGGSSEQGTAGDATAGPGENGQAGEASSGSGPGSSPAGGSNPLTGSDGSVPEIPKEVLAPVGLLWWLFGNSGANVPSGAMPSTDMPGSANTSIPDASDVSVPGLTTGGMPTDAGAGTGTGTNAGPTAVSNSPAGIPHSGAGDNGLPSPGSTGQASPSATSGDITDGQAAGAGSADIPDWLIPVLGGMEMITGHPGAACDSSAPVRLPNGTVIAGSGTPAETVTAITDYSRPITKGTVFDVNGTVALADGTPVAGMIVDVYLARDKASPDWISCGRTVAVDGRFVAECEAPDDVPPGDYNLIARSLDNVLYRGSDSDPLVSLVSPTRLSIDAPGSVRSGEGCVVSVALAESVTGLPLGGQPVDVSIGSFSASGVTDDRGIATVKAESLPDGTLTIVATYQGQDGYLGSRTQRDITVAPVDLLELFLYGLLALVALLVLAVTVMLAHRAWINRRRLLEWLYEKRHRSHPVEAEPVLEEAFVPRPASPYVISFPDIDRLLPAVWGTGEELAVLVTGIPGKPVSLALDDQVLLEMMMDDGEAIVPLMLEKGSHSLSVLPAAGGETLATVRVRVVDYREEVVRLFNDLCRRARTRFKAATELATPREFLGTVGRQMPDANDRHLDRIITIFEVANYSLHGLGREDYVKSYLSIKELAL